MRLHDLALSKKLGAAIVILLLPTLLLIYFLISEKDDLIAFTRQEGLGVHYLRVLQQGFALSTVPVFDKNAADSIAMAMEKQEQEDAGFLKLTQNTADVVAALRAGNVSDVNSKIAAEISAASDNSNITLDPDTDAYFVGDMLVNQSETILQKTSDLVAAAENLRKNKTEDALMAFAIARDELATGAGNFSSDLGKAVKGNADGVLKDTIGGVGNVVAASIDKLSAAATADDYAAVVALAPAVSGAVVAALPKLDDEMERLLNARIKGFYSVLCERIGISLVFIILGTLASLWVIRSISRPVKEIASIMARISAGDLRVEVLHDDRQDEVGHLIQATEAYRDAAVNAVRAKIEEQERHEKDRLRANQISNLTATFSESVNIALGSLHTSVKNVDEAGSVIVQKADHVAEQAMAIASAAEQASANVQTVSAASEELSASIREISHRVHEATNITGKATEEAILARKMVDTLSTATARIGEVVHLITEIAGQTNLLALNATIEAARAGEAGKGFSVVASEVKTLANQTSRATDDISGHISSVQSAVSNVIAAIESIDATISQVNHVSASIASAVEEQGAATQEIARNIQEAATGTADVTLNIRHVADMARDSKQASLDVLNSVKLLETEAERINEDICAYTASVKTV